MALETEQQTPEVVASAAFARIVALAQVDVDAPTFEPSELTHLMLRLDIPKHSPSTARITAEPIGCGPPTTDRRPAGSDNPSERERKTCAMFWWLTSPKGPSN